MTHTHFRSRRHKQEHSTNTQNVPQFVSIVSPGVRGQRTAHLNMAVTARVRWLLVIAVARVTGNGVNILHVIFDDLRPDLGAYGREWARTPHLDDFAQESVMFKQAHAAVANCGPSRVAFMTGRRPDWNGVVDLVTHPRDRDHDVVMLPQALRESAFRYVTVSGCIIIVAPPHSIVVAPSAHFVKKVEEVPS